ncbi:MAG: asparaginase [Pseudobdellovibrionaceae bacterium]
MSPKKNSMKIEVRRGDHLESVHWVDVAVVDSAGKMILSYGEDTKCFPRSAIKPIQALAMMEAGAHEKWSISSQEWALACASHHGEKFHVDIVEGWLRKLGLSSANLECGTHSPYNTKASEEILRKNGQFGAIHNNCSGKHTGFLATALAFGVPTKHYIHFSHPVQKLVTKLTAEFCGISLNEVDSAIDGCGIPTFCFSLSKMAQGFAAFSTDPRGAQILKACLIEPVLTSGSGQFPTLVMGRLNNEIFVKIGAEGVMGAYFPKQGWGLALKARDGAARAAEVATAQVLADLGFLTSSDSTFLSPQKTNWAGRTVSVIQAFG